MRFASMRMTHMSMHELHGQALRQTCLTRQAEYTCSNLSLVLCFILLFTHGMALSRRKKGEKSSGSQERTDPLFHFV